MRLMEYQSKALLKTLGLAFPESRVVDSPEEAFKAVEEMDCAAVIKAQVPFGGRGKAGAIKFVETADEAKAAASELIGMELKGFPVQKVLVEPKVSIAQEFYIGVTWDTSAKLPVAILSAAGGVDVESSDKTKIAQQTFDPRLGLYAFQGREMAASVGLTGKPLLIMGSIIANLAKAFLAIDGVTVEINPIVLTEEGTFIGVDAHVEIEDDAEARQAKKLEPLGKIETNVAGRKPTEMEIEAKRIDSMDHRGVAGRVVEFDGDLGLLIGGGGASLTVFDAILRYGGKPANYAEMGGNPTEEKVSNLTQLILSKPGVTKLAVVMNVVNNTRADVMARGVIDGIRAKGLEPADTIIVFRIPGSWEDEAVQIMADAGVKALGREVSLDECARIAVERMSVNVD